MNEISVVVLQTPGEVSWNYLEIRKRLKDELEVYKKTAYTDDTIKTAKSDIADLRKLAKSIEDRRKEVKEKCLEPYLLIENQAKELVELIEEPIQAINNQVKDYEKRRKEAARKEIMDYWNAKSAVLPGDIKEKALTVIYDDRWENATATKKSWKDGIDAGIKKILDEVATISSFGSEFEEDMLAVYKSDLSLQRAIAKMNELKAQQERILEVERKRQEAEERRKQEEAERAEKAKTAENATPATPVATVQREMTAAPQELQTVEREPAVTKAYPGGKVVRILITGTPEQITKIQNYIRFTGATYQEV